MPNTSLIFSGGLAPNDATLNAARAIQNVNLVIAADSGLHAAQKLEMHVDFVIGDFDSVDASALARATSAHTQTIRHSADKDFTDLESALLFAADKKSERIVIVTAGGGRLDHQFGQLPHGAPGAAEGAHAPVHREPEHPRCARRDHHPDGPARHQHRAATQHVPRQDRVQRARPAGLPRGR